VVAIPDAVDEPGKPNCPKQVVLVETVPVEPVTLPVAGEQIWVAELLLGPAWAVIVAACADGAASARAAAADSIRLRDMMGLLTMTGGAGVRCRQGLPYERSG
jgi:hypothetical protein